MTTIKVEDVIIPENRIRRHFDQRAIQELADSLSKPKGLIQPIVLRDDGRTLVAGERRLRAARLLGWTEIKCVTLSSLSEEQLNEAELEENTIRRDLTWQETAVARANLHALRVAQTNGAQTMRQTAAEITGTGGGGATEIVRDSLIIQKHLDDPDVAAAPDAKKAMQVIRKKAEKTILAAIGRAGLEAKTDHTLLEGDSREVLRGLPSSTFDLIITDPPYAIEMKNSGQALNQHEYEDSVEEVMPMLEEVITELTRVSAVQCHAYMFCDVLRFQQISLLWAMAGWGVWPRPIIWYKGNMGFLPRPKHGPRRTYECILFANKGDREVEVEGAHDVISIPQERNLVHAAQKPIDLYIELMNRSARPGQRVIDPFGGSGPVLAAATRKGLIATYIEKDPTRVAEARGLLTVRG